MRTEEDKRQRSFARRHEKDHLKAGNKPEQALMQTQEALRAAAERLQLTLAASQLGDWSFDISTSLVTLGARAAEIFGLPLATSLPQSEMDRLVFEEDRDLVRSRMDHAVRSRQDLELKHRILTPTGQKRWVACRACCNYDKDGRLLGLIGVVQDISARREADEAVRQSEARFRQLADSMPQIVWTAGPDGVMDYFNQRWYESTSGPGASAGAGAWKVFVHPDDVKKCRTLWFEAVRTGKRFENEYRFKDKSGCYRWHLGRALPVRDEDGAVVRWFGTSTDIHDQKCAEEQIREETRILELLNKTGSVIASTLDLESLMQTVTDAATEITGARIGAFYYNRADRHGSSMSLYTLSGSQEAALQALARIRSAGHFDEIFRGGAPILRADLDDHGELDAHTADQHPAAIRSFLAVPVVSRLGGVLGGLFFGHPEPDIFIERSERLALGVAGQAAVALDNARLYEDVKFAAEEREKLLDAERSARLEAEKASGMKDDFLATLSHELRTPLTAILGWAQILASGTTDPARLKKGIETIGRNARAQTQLIEDLLDMNRITSGKLQLHTQPVSMVEVINAAIESVRLSLEAKDLRLRTLLDPNSGQIHGDPSRLQQICWNLLSNAVKFTPAGGRIEVLLETVGTQLEFTVDDSGKGISADLLPHIFERFRQGDSSSTRAHGGLGLGLAIVKHLVELHGGTVRVRSPGEGLGATFTIALPLPIIRLESGDEGPAAWSALSASADCGLQGVKVLVVDDVGDTRELVESILVQAGAGVETAVSADDALARISAAQPDVLVSDIGMADKDGYQFLQEVRRLSSAQGGQVPAVALTGFARAEDRVKALTAGFQRHVSKPIEPQELIAIICELTRPLR